MHFSDALLLKPFLSFRWCFNHINTVPVKSFNFSRESSALDFIAALSTPFSPSTLSPGQPSFKNPSFLSHLFFIILLLLHFIPNTQQSQKIHEQKHISMDPSYSLLLSASCLPVPAASHLHHWLTKRDQKNNFSIQILSKVMGVLHRCFTRSFSKQ